MEVIGIYKNGIKEYPITQNGGVVVSVYYDEGGKYHSYFNQYGYEWYFYARSMVEAVKKVIEHYGGVENFILTGIGNYWYYFEERKRNVLFNTRQKDN